VAFIDTDQHYDAFRKDILTGVHVYCGTSQKVSRHENSLCCYHISIPSYFLHHTVFGHCAVCLHHSAVFSRPIKVAKNIVIEELLDNPFSVSG
jgi:hypothetical protein